jgi:hypothetical protein
VACVGLAVVAFGAALWGEEKKPSATTDANTGTAVNKISAAPAVTPNGSQTTPCRAQKKRDIRGFCPGMSILDVNAQLLAQGCALDKDGGFRPPRCKVEEGELGFLFSEHLSPPVLFQVTYRFESGIHGEKMVERISKEFGARPLSSSAEIKDAIFHAAIPRKVPGVFWGTYDVTGGRVTDWDLGQGFRLMLDLDAGLLAQATTVSYELTLSNEKVRGADHAASAAKREAQRAKINPNPKF